MFNAYSEIATDLIVNIAAIFLLAYVLYFRRHRRADLLLSYVALNIGIFVAISLLTTVRVDIALGIIHEPVPELAAPSPWRTWLKQKLAQFARPS